MNKYVHISIMLCLLTLFLFGYVVFLNLRLSGYKSLTEANEVLNNAIYFLSSKDNFSDIDWKIVGNGLDMKDVNNLYQVKHRDELFLIWEFTIEFTNGSVYFVTLHKDERDLWNIEFHPEIKKY